MFEFIINFPQDRVHFVLLISGITGTPLQNITIESFRKDKQTIHCHSIQSNCSNEHFWKILQKTAKALSLYRLLTHFGAEAWRNIAKERHLTSPNHQHSLWIKQRNLLRLVGTPVRLLTKFHCLIRVHGTFEKNSMLMTFQLIIVFSFLWQPARSSLENKLVELFKKIRVFSFL